MSAIRRPNSNPNRRRPPVTRQMIGEGVEVIPARPSRFACRVAVRIAA